MKTHKIFESNPNLKEVHMTSDGESFYNDNDAKAHAKTLKDKSVELVVNASLIEVTTDDIDDEYFDAGLEAPKVETAKVDAPKVKAPKVETAKVETPKVEAPKVETPKEEAPKVDAPKEETAKVDAPKVDAPKVETPKDSK